ncbi:MULTISPECIES: hypothetical protein [Pseudomonas]|uniref:hypothetical protein n=1 Tax=Pseudomonas nitroreducens TaxID=46680 RepID=UPI001E38834C|nr:MULTISPECIES: hypothetical protein [Pseudomonas]MCE4073551.1 hypothetical protein [Pseudomonas nitritireducens]MCE4079790.1 hypothetical protein [Pseudomonas nitroreducens]
MRSVSVRFLRDGEGTASYKKAKLFSNADDMALLAIFQGTGAAATLTQRFQASVFDGQWLMVAVDNAAPRLAKASYVDITSDVEVLVDITSGDSSGGLPATMEARVRVDGQPAGRELVVVERPLNGEWRVAGYGTSTGGETELSLRLAGNGLVYAVCVDSWGVGFQPSLLVSKGDLIRPSLFVGWLYRITQSGQLPASEPEWWDATLSGPQPVGTARAEVVRYYRPQAHGPQPVEMT